MLKSLGLGLGLETFAKFLRVSVSVSDNFVSEKKSRFRRNLVSEKSLGFGFGNLVSEKKSRFWFQKNFVSEKSLRFGFGKFGIGKKFRYRFRSKFWYCGQHHYPSQLWATPWMPSSRSTLQQGADERRLMFAIVQHFWSLFLDSDA